MEALLSSTGNQGIVNKNIIKFIRTDLNAGSMSARVLFAYSEMISSMSDGSKSELFIKPKSFPPVSFKRCKAR